MTVAAIDDLIRVPFVRGGRDPRTGLDCYGLTIEAGRILGVDVPDLWDLVASWWSDEHSAADELVPDGWESVVEPFPVGTVLLMFRSARNRAVTHVAMVVADGMLLHTYADGFSRKVPVWRVREQIHSGWRPTSC